MASGSSARDLDGGEAYRPLGTARLFYRDLGHGLPIVILHGGPAYNHNYLPTGEATPGSRLVVLADFSYVDTPNRIHELIAAFFQPSNHRP